MTNKEAIRVLEAIRKTLAVDDGETPCYLRERLEEAYDKAIAALRPWKRLSEETPTKPKRYWVHREKPKKGYYHYVCATWTGSSFVELGWALKDITHWCEINPPEDD